MVSCKLYGRLGNQMFQIAATIGYALLHDLPYFIPVRSVDPIHFPSYFPELIAKNPGRGMRTLTIYREPTHAFTEIPLLTDILLDGFFQSEKYFLHCRREIIDAFSLGWFKKTGVVSIHVRRGDYLLLQDKHPAVNRIYLSVAFAYFRKLGYKEFLVFSDDINWFRDFFSGFEKWSGCKFSYSEGHAELEDMYLMSCCEHHIIANSTFSWWAAWLNQNPDKIVIAPKVWFGPGNAHLDTKDLLPETWLKM